MNPLEAAVLGVVQGLTEFLPVSSSGHLVLGKAILGVRESGIAFEVFVHFGTLLAVVSVFWNDIFKLFQAFLKLIQPHKIPVHYRNDNYFRWLIFIIIATIPAVIIGLLFEDRIETVFTDPHLVAGMLLITGTVLLATIFCKRLDKRMGFFNSIAVGLAQAVAILPGISRSGSTISIALFLGVNSEDAARFSFLLALPAIAGATLLKIFELLSVSITREFLLSLIIGTITAYISGFIAIKLLLGIVRKGKLFWFSAYCFLIGILGLILT